MKKTIVALFAGLLCIPAIAVENPVQYASPRMGTQSNHALSTGNLYPAIARPWGMNFWTPQMNNMGDGWTYSYGGLYPNGRFEQKIKGFKQTHQPSPWINDYGQFSLMPVTGKKAFDQHTRASWFSHKAETATPYYYSVYLADHDVFAEFAPTERACIFRFSYPQTDSAFLVIDAFDRGSYIRLIPEENRIVGYTTRNSGGVPENFKNYFVIQFEEPFFSAEIFADKEIQQGGLEKEAQHVGAVIGIRCLEKKQINVRVASSFISFEQAALNLQELKNDPLETVAQAGKNAWNEALGRIEIEGGSVDQYRTFYSCLYRSLLFPRKFFEIDKTGQVVHYSPYNGQVLPGYMFTDTGFWDTFRCLFPLLNLVYPDLSAQIQEGLINTYKESHFFPEWASPGHRSCMVGNNSASVLADAFLQGIKVKDTNTLWEGLVYTANHQHEKTYSTGRAGYEYYNRLGYVPCDVKINESAARTLEYAYDDWCIYQVGKAMNRPETEIGIYAERSRNYRNLFRSDYNLMCGRQENGRFNDPFSPFKWGGDFTEGNALHYTWSVFHDPQGLIDLMGGNQTFNSVLDTVFSLPPIFDDSYYGGTIHEIREMQIMNMGNYAHGNQPIQHMIYLYNYAGQPWKAQYHLRKVMNQLYSATPDGYCGDEDNGQTSAWYVFSALGFYPVCPGSGQYVIGSPLFSKAVLHLRNGKEFVIHSEANRDENVYVQELHLNGQIYDKNFFAIDELKQGGTARFRMGNKPNTVRGVSPSSRPYSFSRGF